MAKLQTIVFFVGIMLLIGAALCLYFSLRNLSFIRARQHTRTLAFIPYTHQPAKTRDGEAAQRGGSIIILPRHKLGI